MTELEAITAQSPDLTNSGGFDQEEAKAGDTSTSTGTMGGSHNNDVGDDKSVAAMSIGSSMCTSTAPIISGCGRKEDAAMKLAFGIVTSQATECSNVDKSVASSENRGNEAENDHATRVNGIAVQISNADEDEAPLNKVEEHVDATSPLSFTGHDSNKKRLSERLKQRLAKRHEKQSEDSSEKKADSPSKSTIRERSTLQARLHRRQSRKNSSGKTGSYSDILSKYGSDDKEFPDAVTFSDGEDDKPSNASQSATNLDSERVPYRKSASEIGVGYSSLSSRISRIKLVHKRPVSHMHGIGILQAEGIVYDDAMLLRLARQARYNRLRGEVSTATTHADTGGARRYNEVKLHVYDLLTKDALVEMPYFNCHFPVGQCFRSVNDACHALGTGAYHIGVEVSSCSRYCARCREQALTVLFVGEWCRVRFRGQ